MKGAIVPHFRLVKGTGGNGDMVATPGGVVGLNAVIPQGAVCRNGKIPRAVINGIRAGTGQ